MNRTLHKACEDCGTPFVTNRVAKRFCSDTCKQMAYFKRKGMVFNTGTTNRSYNTFAGNGTVVKQGSAQTVKYGSANTVKYGNAISVKYGDENNHAENIPESNMTKNIPAYSGTEVKNACEQEFDEQEEYVNVYSQFLIKISAHTSGPDIWEKCDMELICDEEAENISWVDERLRCLLESVIKLSNYTSIDLETMIALTDAFGWLIASKQFRKLPKVYPLRSLILDLSSKLNAARQDFKQGQAKRLRLNTKRKAELVGIRYDMMCRTETMKFSELTF